MKKTLLLLVLISISAFSFAQTCVRDSSVIASGALLSPAPYTTALPNYNLAVACINLNYNQSVTVNVPPTYSGIPINNVTIATTGAVAGLPTGVSYVCDPPNCVFLASQLGCILLSGTPAVSNPAPDTVELAITATVNTVFAPLTLAFPGEIAPGSHYYLILRTEAGCMSAATEPNQIGLGEISTSPNPFSDHTIINVHAMVEDDFTFEVFDVAGQRLSAQQLHLIEGANQIEFEAGNLANGTYFYAISTAQGKVLRKMIVLR